MNAVRIWSAAAAISLGMGAISSAAYAQASGYPSKAVTIIADAAPGSTPDVDARFVAEGLGKMWGRQVVVIEHPGAFGSIAARAAAEAAPDGYTLYMPALATFVAPKTSRTECAAAPAARFHSDRIHRREPDVRRGQSFAWREHAA